MIRRWDFLLFMGVELALLAHDIAVFETTDLSIVRFSLAVIARLIGIGIGWKLYQQFGEDAIKQ
jgi:hypothetical protein